jgi:hypothetical protein
MSWYVTHRVGGELHRGVLVEMFETAADLGLLVEANDVRASTILKDDRLDGDVSDLLSADGSLAFYGAEHDDDSFPSLEELCMRVEVPFVSVVDADEEAGGITRWWNHGMDGTGRSDSDHDGEPVLTLKSVRDAVADGSIARLIEESTIPELAPVTVVD